MCKEYYRLAKPGIIYGNILTTIAGYLFGVHLLHVHLVVFVALVIGTSLVIGSACVYNNYIDRDLDKHMARTKKRALVEGTISGRSALIYATVLGILGYGLLILWTNWLVVLVGAIAFIDYVALYGLSKRKSVQGTLVGSISGAAPIVAGYVAATDHFDGAALILFILLVLWQMPHFYAIAIYRLKDYASANVPVLPVKKGIYTARAQIIGYIIAFTLATVLLRIFGYAGWICTIIMFVASLLWLRLALQGLKAPDLSRWARKVFFFSLIIIVVLSLMLSIGSYVA